MTQDLKNMNPYALLAATHSVWRHTSGTGIPSSVQLWGSRMALHWPSREANGLTWGACPDQSSGQMVYGSVGQLHPVQRAGSRRHGRLWEIVQVRPGEHISRGWWLFNNWYPNNKVSPHAISLFSHLHQLLIKKLLMTLDPTKGCHKIKRLCLNSCFAVEQKRKNFSFFPTCLLTVHLLAGDRLCFPEEMVCPALGLFGAASGDTHAELHKLKISEMRNWSWLLIQVMRNSLLINML